MQPGKWVTAASVTMVSNLGSVMIELKLLYVISICINSAHRAVSVTLIKEFLHMFARSSLVGTRKLVL